MKSISRNGINLPRLPKPLEPGGLAGAEDHSQISQILASDDNLTGVRVAALLLEQVCCRRVLFTESHLEALRCFDSRLERCDLSAAAWEKARFRRSEFTGCRLIGANFGEANFEDVIFSDCNAEGAYFGQAVFKSVRFEKCNLRKATFESADLSGVVFQDCDLGYANLRGAKLSGTDFRSAAIDGVQSGIQEFQGAIISPVQAVQVVNLMGVIVRDLEETL